MLCAIKLELRQVPFMPGLVMRMRTDRSHAVGLNASVHTQIIGVTQASA